MYDVEVDGSGSCEIGWKKVKNGDGSENGCAFGVRGIWNVGGGGGEEPDLDSLGMSYMDSKNEYGIDKLLSGR